MYFTPLIWYSFSDFLSEHGFCSPQNLIHIRRFLMDFETTTDEIGNKVKKLPPSVVKDIELKNHARRLANLSQIRIKVRACIACGTFFESAGNRTCGCNTRSTGFIAGREII
jgi:hypothetical protein